MAVRFDAAADRLLRTSDLLNYNNPYTWMFWLNMSVDLNAITVPAALFRDAGNVDDLRTLADGTTIGIRSRANGVGGTVSGSNLTIGTWYHIAMVREASNILKLYVNGILDATATQSVTTRDVVTRMELGAESASNSNPVNGKVSTIKAWYIALTQLQVTYEINSIFPLHKADVYGYWPTFSGVTERLKDYSPNTRNWTSAGTLTDESNPPSVEDLANITKYKGLFKGMLKEMQ